MLNIEKIETGISAIMEEINSPITSIPSIDLAMEAQNLAKIGDFNNFDIPDKTLAYARLSPSTHQSGKLY